MRISRSGRKVDGADQPLFTINVSSYLEQDPTAELASWRTLAVQGDNFDIPGALCERVESLEASLDEAGIKIAEFETLLEDSSTPKKKRRMR